MSGYKNKGYNQRKRKSGKDGDTAASDEKASPTVLLFRSYQVELDAKYDKYERLIKKSRDLTIESKRIIFLLHRVYRGNNEQNEKILEEAKHRLSALFMTIINDIGLELSKREVYQYIKAFTNGLQEFVEALSFYHYLKNGNIMHLDEIFTDSLVEPTETLDEPMEKSDLPLSAFLTPIEYVLGIADLTGELMRKCINSVGSGDFEEPFKLCALLQSMYPALLQSSNNCKDLKRKLFTLKCSVQKVENACYAIKIRGTEIPSHMLADFFSTDDDFNKEAECCDL